MWSLLVPGEISKTEKEKENKVILISSLSKTRPTAVLRANWPNKENYCFTNFRDLMQFYFFPPGLFSRVLILLLPNTNTIFALWENVMLTTITNKPKSYIEYGPVQLLEQKTLSRLKLFCQVWLVDLMTPHEVFTSLMDIVHKIIANWESLQVHQYVLFCHEWSWRKRQEVGSREGGDDKMEVERGRGVI